MGTKHEISNIFGSILALIGICIVKEQPDLGHPQLDLLHCKCPMGLEWQWPITATRAGVWLLKGKKHILVRDKSPKVTGNANLALNDA